MSIRHKRRLELERILDRIGATNRQITVSNGGHLKIALIHNDRERFIITSATPSDRRGLRNFECNARRIWADLTRSDSTI